jgi:hypothetical protein
MTRRPPPAGTPVGTQTQTPAPSQPYIFFQQPSYTRLAHTMGYHNQGQFGIGMPIGHSTGDAQNQMQLMYMTNNSMNGRSNLHDLNHDVVYQTDVLIKFNKYYNDNLKSGNLSYLTRYIAVNEGRTKVMKDKSSDDNGDIKEKAKYIRHVICGIDGIRKILEKCVRHGYNWYDIMEYKKNVLKIVEKYILKKLKKKAKKD